MNKQEECKDDLLTALKSLLNKDYFSSQVQITKALKLIGFRDITQPKVARLIKKVGAIKAKGNSKSYFYQIPDNLYCSKENSISSLVKSINSNELQVVIKTIRGGGGIIANIIESHSHELGILGCLASDSTILIIPAETKKMDSLIKALSEYLN